MKKIFISRDLDEGSVFKKMLTEQGFEVVENSLVEFLAVPNISVPPADWVFFYSKNAVRFFCQAVGLRTLLTYKTAALGPGTSETLRTAGLLPDFVGDGDPSSTAEAFLNLAKGSKVLFPRASESRQSVQRILAGQIESLDLVVYENIAKRVFQVPDCQALVFTSPLNAKAYFSKYRFREEEVIAIGQTTAACLSQLNITGYKVAEFPSEKALAELVISLLGDG